MYGTSNQPSLWSPDSTERTKWLNQDRPFSFYSKKYYSFNFSENSVKDLIVYSVMEPIDDLYHSSHPERFSPKTGMRCYSTLFLANRLTHLILFHLVTLQPTNCFPVTILSAIYLNRTTIWCQQRSRTMLPYYKSTKTESEQEKEKLLNLFQTKYPQPKNQLFPTQPTIRFVGNQASIVPCNPRTQKMSDLMLNSPIELNNNLSKLEHNWNHIPYPSWNPHSKKARHVPSIRCAWDSAKKWVFFFQELTKNWTLLWNFVTWRIIQSSQ